MFWAPCGSGGGGLGGWGGGCPPHMCTHMRACTHAHARTCMRDKHDNSMQMAAPIGFGEIPGIPYDVIHACVCMCMCVCMCACVCMCTCVGGPCHHPPPNSNHPPGWGTPGISQNSIALDLIEIFQFCLKI